MQIIRTSTKLSENSTRYRVKIESDECEADSYLAQEMKQMLLRSVAEDPNLLTCGTAPFQTLKLAHNGVMWIMEAEATIEQSNAQKLASSK
jgi:hypothetical protein